MIYVAQCMFCTGMYQTDVSFYVTCVQWWADSAKLSLFFQIDNFLQILSFMPAL